MPETCLFLGGPKDGQRTVVDHDRPWHQVLVNDRPAPLCLSDLETTSATLRTVEYHRLCLRGEKETFSLFLAEGMTADEALRRLLEKYPHP